MPFLSLLWSYGRILHFLRVVCPSPTRGLHAAAEGVDACACAGCSPSYQAADRSLQLPIVFCWALGGESNNVTFLIRITCEEHREVMRMPRVQQRLGSSGRIHPRGCACAYGSCSDFVFVYATAAAARLTIGEDGVCWVQPVGAT